LKPQIVNIINFIRGVEPRESIDLLEPVQEQLKLIKNHGLTATFLMQYDALINPDFVKLLSLYAGDIEIGGWLEIVQPMCEAAGIQWRGRPGFSWDWHANVGFTVGYTKEERIALADAFMKEFKNVWGYYPASVGSWVIDAYTLAYLSDRYGIVASCNCKDQWGTDGYTLWGGYYSQAYYPSRKNVLCPAQSIEQQIPVPIFRMLGSDPIYQYDLGLDINSKGSDCQKVVTLEPVYSGSGGGGGNPDWVDWFFEENFNGICLTFAYAQVGQENNFGWDLMKDGLTYQTEKLAELSQEGRVSVQTLAQSGKWFKENFALTPASSVVALSDWKKEGYRSIWYNCRNYRVNIICNSNRFWIRDIYIFNENYKERYLEEVCDRPHLIYDNLPVMDGNRWSGNGVLAGIYPVYPDGREIVFEKIEVFEKDERLLVKWELSCGGVVTCNLNPAGMDWSFPTPEFGFVIKLNHESVSASITLNADFLKFEHRGFKYVLEVVGALITFSDMDKNPKIVIRGYRETIQIKFR